MLFNSPVKTLFASLAIAALFVLLMLQGAAYPGPGPTPIPAADSDGDVHRELAEWWDWCLRHPNCVMRPNRVYRVTGRGVSGRDFDEKLKVTGALPGRPPFASMIRTQTYRPFVRDGVLVGLWSDGWSYQTSSSTDIGVGPAQAVDYEVPE